MKKLLLSLAILLAAAILAVPDAHAEIVLGASVGQSDVETGGFNDDDTGAQFYAGFRFLKLLGLELEYTDFGTFEQGSGASSESLEVTRLDLFVLGVIPLGRFELYGKVGYGYWDSDFRSGGMTQSDDDADKAYGAGVAIKFAKLIAIRAEYEVFEIDGNDDLTMASIGIDFRF